MNILIVEFTKRHNLNRGYMKLEVWNDGVALFKSIYQVISKIPNFDIKLQSQLLDAAQSISSNIAEGYCRKSINEYLYFLNIALGSCGEFLTRSIGLKAINLFSTENFDEIDKLHYAVENKLLALIMALQSKRKEGNWDQEVHENLESYES